MKAMKAGAVEFLTTAESERFLSLRTRLHEIIN
jgi:hypothetical protein